MLCRCELHGLIRAFALADDRPAFQLVVAQERLACEGSAAVTQAERMSAGTATGQHHLGSAAVWRVLPLVQAYLYPARRHAVYVCGSSRTAHQLVWHPQQLTWA